MARSPFDFDISVSADKKKRARGRRGTSGAVETSQRECEHAGCQKAGQYRAPRSRDKSDEFLWFCLDHVREYNLKWNFFENHSEEELEDQIKRDRLWDRPTKPFKTDDSGLEQRAWARLGIEDPLEVLGEKGTQSSARRASTGRKLSATERRAVQILDVRDSWTKAEIRKAYKSLVKDLHPDMNGGARADEERLQEVVWAWEQIKVSRSFAE